jgi:tetratricopeptide (TPR) repeat protein
MSLKVKSKRAQNRKSAKAGRAQVRRLTEPAESYSPTMSRPILPGRWQVNTGLFLLLMIGTLALYWRDLGIGFFIIDDYGYVTDDPWIKGITLTNLRHILFTPHFANYSPVHLLSYLLDHTIAGLNPFAYHLSSNIWAGVVAGCVFLVALALTGRRMIAVAAAALFVVHPAHVEAIAWISNRKDIIAAAFTLPSFLAYLCYRRQGDKAYWWYGASVFLFLLGVAGKLSVATFPAVLLALDLFVEKRPLKQSLLDKVPFFVVGVVIALGAASAQPPTGNRPDPYVLANALLQNLWLLSGFGSYVVFHVPPDPHKGMALQFPAAVLLLAVFAGPLLLRRRAPLTMTLIYWILFGLIPAQVLSFVHPVADRYLFFPSVGFVILVAWWALTIGERYGRRGVIAAAALLLLGLVLWGRATVVYLSEWQDPRSVWYKAVQKSSDADVYHMLGAQYLNLAQRLGVKPRGDRLPDAQARRLASTVWQKDPQLPALLAEWNKGQRGGPVEEVFQRHLWTLAWDAFETSLHAKGTRAIPALIYRRGVLLLDRGDLQGARKEFLEALDENKRSTVTTAREDVVCYNGLGDVASKEEDYREALRWYRMAEDKQRGAGVTGVTGIDKSRERMEGIVALLPGSAPTGKPDDPNACYLLAVRYLDAADRLGATLRGTPLPQDKAERLANDVWPSDARLQALLSEWKAGQHGGPVEKAFQDNLRTLAWDLLERGLRTKGDRPMARLYFRRGTVLGVRGDLNGARKEFLAALDDASRETDINAQHEMIVDSHDALGVLAQTGGDYREALRWFRMAEEEQARFGGRWVPDITAKRQKMEAMIASKPGS